MKRGIVGVLLTLALFGCAQDKGGGAQEQDSEQVITGLHAIKNDQPKVPAPRIDADRAFQYVKDLCAMGPRPVASAAHKKMEAYIVGHLKNAGAQIEDDAFQQDSPQGKYPLRNIVAKFPGSKDGVIV